MSKQRHHVTSKRVQKLLGVYVKIKMLKSMMRKKKSSSFVYGGIIEKSVPQDHRLSSLGKPRDAKQ